MTTPIFKLTKGVRYIDLQAGRYRVHQGWAPPSAAILPLLAEGTSANRNGAALAGRRPVTRSFSLRVNVTGSTDAEIRRGVNDIDAMLALAGDDLEPLYLEFRPNSDTPEPLWGNYGVNLRYEIVSGSVEVEKSYLTGARLANDVDVVLSLTVKPYAVGKGQRVASAIGGVIENTYGSPDGVSRGMVVCPAAASAALGNEITNPVFGNSTYDTGWSVDASLTKSRNTSAQFVLFGSASMKLVSRGASQKLYMAINTGDTNTHQFLAYVKRPDGAAVSSADVQLYYNAALTTTYTNVGEGWYKLTASAAGINAATNIGLIMPTGRTVYVAGLMMIESSVEVPFFYGDMLGCSWNSTAHASASLRTAGRVRLPVSDDTFEIGQWSIRAVVSPYVANTFANNMQIFSMGATNIRASFVASDDTFRLTDNTTTLTSAAQTFAAGDVVVLHYTASPTNGIALYINGVSAATNATYTPPTLGSYIYIGTDDTPATHFPGTFMDFAVFSDEFTATEVLADYANMAALLSDGQRVGTVPWLWTKDGDDVVDNADDSSRDNWCVVGGVPGSAQADTLYLAGSSAGFYDGGPPAAYTDVYISLCDLKYGDFLPPANWLYFDKSGTVDANASGGEYLSTSVTTTEATEIASTDFVADYFARMGGRDVFVIMRLYDEGTGAPSMYLRLYPSASLTEYINTSSLQLVSTTQNAWRLLKFGSFVMPDIRNRDLSTASWSTPHWELRALRASGTNNLRFDYLAIVPRPLLQFSINSAGPVAIIRGANGMSGANWTATADGDIRLQANVYGEPIDLYPDRLNLLMSFIGSGSADPTITYTLTYYRVIVTPRYAIL